MRIAKWLQALLFIGALAMQSGLAHSAPEAGWWWNPNESGRGFFIESQNGIVFLAGYFYESDGRATWLVSGGPNADPYSYAGRLSAVRGGQTLFGTYQPPNALADAGAVTLHFSDDTHGTITWPGGTIAIERQRFGGATAPFQPDSGWWWNPEESGRGYSIEVQGEYIFVVAFMYDSGGNPLWYLSAGKMASPTSYQGAWLQFANGQTLTGTYQPPTTPVTVGQLSVEFTAIDEATLTISGDSTASTQGALKANKVINVPVQRQFRPVKPTYVLPARYDGRFAQTGTIATNQGAAVTKITYTVTGALTWVEDNEVQLAPLRGPSQSYMLLPNLANKPIVLNYKLSQVATDGGKCDAAIVDKAYALTDAGSTLTVNGYAQYSGVIELADLLGQLDWTCVDTFGEVTTYTTPVRVPVRMAFTGAISYGVTGGPRVTVVLDGDPSLSITDSWSFAAVSTQ